MTNKKKTAPTKKIAVKKSTYKKNQPKKVQVVSQSPVSKKKRPKGTITSSEKVDTSTLINKWTIYVDDWELDPLWKSYDDDNHCTEHKLFESANVVPEKIKIPLWTHILWWFMK